MSQKILVLISGKLNEEQNIFQLPQLEIHIETLIKLDEILKKYNIQYDLSLIQNKNQLQNFKLNQNDKNHQQFIEENQQLQDKIKYLDELDDINEYSGFLILDQINFYNELYFEVQQNEINLIQTLKNNKMKEIINKIVKQNKYIAAIGFGMLPLLICFDENQQWHFKDYNIQSIKYQDEYQQTYILNIPFAINEIILNLEGKFIQSTQSQSLVIDGKLITGLQQNFNLIVNNLCFLISEQNT